MQNKITYSEMAEMFREHEKNATDGSHINGYIVFTEDSFDKPYTLAERTYGVSSNNKAYLPGMLGYSIFGSSLDGSDRCVRLENYMKDEYGGDNGWTVDYCYLGNEESKKRYYVSFSFHARYDTEVEADSLEEAKDIGWTDFEMANFGEINGCEDAMLISITDEDGNEKYFETKYGD